MTPTHRYDVVILGSGAAGLTLALQLDSRYQVAVISKETLHAGSTWYAQGGISAVIDTTDSVDSFVEDTLNAGAGLCRESVVRYIAEHSKEEIDWLIDLGMPFTHVEDGNNESEYHLTREGGHSHRRVIHSKDATGHALSKTLIARAKEHSNIHIFEDYIAIDLITNAKLEQQPQKVLGAYVHNKKTGRTETFQGHKVVLASGGASKVYLYTSNPDVSTGDGIAMAWRAGCRIANMEFIQFHPTCLFHPHAKSYLISEAVRGEGGHLLLPDGTRFMKKVDPRAELAPRDIVARTIDHEMKKRGLDCVYLDISFKPAEFIKSYFPTIYKRCLKFGIDMTREPIPVVPAAHYTCGGVITNQHGQTDIDGLYAIGETAWTGMHGANRMASNSLLECLVFGAAGAKHINSQLKSKPSYPRLPDWDESRVTDSDEEIVVAHNWDELRHFMWDYVGIVRTNKRLERAMRRVNLLSKEIFEYYSNFRVSNDLIELRNLVVVAELIIRCAMARKESRGLHYTLDYPKPDTSEPPQDTILTPPNYQEPEGYTIEDVSASA
ncbi:MAG: L-aspartate oxidase [Gammaproteobacteria bacterium]|jgi:L-aspartate oxidase